MAEDNRLQSAAMLMVVGGSLVVSGVRRWRRTRKVEDTATAPIATAAQGLAEFQGHAWPLANGFTQTLRGEPAVYYHLILQKHVKRGKRSEWETIYEEHHNAPFIFVDKSAMALVNPAGGEVDSMCQTRAWKRLHLPEQESLKKRVAGTLGDFSPGWFSSYRVVETVILMGSPLYGTGNFFTPNERPEVLAYPGLADFTQFAQLAAGGGGVRMLDRDKDGKVSDEEASLGLHFTARNVAAMAVKTAPQGTRYGWVGVLSSNEVHRLFLADCHQHHLLDRVGSGNLARILAGSLLIGMGVAVLFMPRF